jgi:hypothetical protein
MPDIAAKHERVTCPRDDGLRTFALPRSLAGVWCTPGAMAARDQPRRREVGCHRVQIEVHRQNERGNANVRRHRAFRPGERQVVDVQRFALESGVRSPCSLADHVTIGAEHGLGQVDHAGSIEKLQPMAIAIENAQVSVEESAAALVRLVPVPRRERVDSAAGVFTQIRRQRAFDGGAALLADRLCERRRLVDRVAAHGFQQPSRSASMRSLRRPVVVTISMIVARDPEPARWKSPVP